MGNWLLLDWNKGLQLEKEDFILSSKRVTLSNCITAIIFDLSHQNSL